MRKSIFPFLVFCGVFGGASVLSQAFASEIPVHERMSQKAAEQSELIQHLPALGLQSLNDQLTHSGMLGRTRSVVEWIQNGSNEEDGSLRFANHFYNPLNGQGLTFEPIIFCNPPGDLPNGRPSTDWGLEENGINQDFSFKDARGALFKGLTESDPATRENHLATMFKTLGHVIHLIQDMAQPEHTRNDPHGPGCLGDGAFYESHTNRRLEALPYEGYGAVYSSTETNIFTTPRSFWTTNDKKGLADYSNRGFVTQATNFDVLGNPSTGFLEPNTNGATETEIDMTPKCQQLNLSIPCIFKFIGTDVEDLLRPTTPNEKNKKTSTFSIFNADMKKFNTPVTYTDPVTGQPFTTSLLYTLNVQNFDAMNEFLIPRAVGYSAGFINYFFRGKIDLVPDPQDVTRVLILNQGDEDMTGTFTLYYDDEQEVRKAVQSWTTGEFAPDGTLAAQTNMSVPRFTIPNTPPPAISSGFTLVFSGEMGAEQPIPPNLPNPSPGAVVAKQIFCSPLFITAGGRLANAGNGWLFQPDSSVQSGTVDWVWANGCQRFSWQGPFGRYLYPRHTSDLSDKIFSGGGIVATAPGPVLGVAVQQGADPTQKFLLAVVAEIDEFDRIKKDTVYVTRLDDPTTWVFVGEFDTFASAETLSRPHRTEYPSHYYFNAAGTQAVSVKRTAKGASSSSASLDENPWRKVIMDVSVTAAGSSLGGTASFALSSAQPLDTKGTSSSTSTGTRPNYSYSRQFDLDYRAKSIIADYLGNQLVELHLDVEEHEAASGVSSQEANGIGSTSYSESQQRMVVLRTSLGWSWNMAETDNVAGGSSQSDENNELTIFQVNEGSFFRLDRGLEYLDLRFDPPVVAYEENEFTSFSLRRESNNEVVEDVETHESRQRLAWLIAGSRHLVRSVDTTDAPSEYFLPGSGLALLQGSNIPPEVGTFAVGGPPHQPQVIGAHKNPRSERDFMFPAGDLSAFGGGPVGF